MTFKDYLNENTSDQILANIKNKGLPLSPKFFEEVFNQGEEQYCFISMKANRIQSLIKRQNKKNQISTFTDFKNTEIFWGAEGLAWGGDTIVAVLKGKVTIKGNRDLWTKTDHQGRRWIDYKDLKEMTDEYDGVGVALLKVIENVYIDFNKIYKTQQTQLTRYDNKDVVINVYIKDFFDIVYKYLKKYKTQIQQGRNTNQTNLYNEVLCYDYTIKEFIVLTNQAHSSYDYRITKEEIDNTKPYKTTKVHTENEIEKILRKYQKLKA